MSAYCQTIEAVEGISRTMANRVTWARQQIGGQPLWLAEQIMIEAARLEREARRLRLIAERQVEFQAAFEAGRKYAATEDMSAFDVLADFTREEQAGLLLGYFDGVSLDCVDPRYADAVADLRAARG